MEKKILIVEDEFVEANDIQLMLIKAGYKVCGIARTVDIAIKMVEKEKPDFVLVDIFLKGKWTGIDLAHTLNEKNIPFIYVSANSNEHILAAAKRTHPYGFIVKPFRERDLLTTLEIAQYRAEHSLESKYRKETELLHRLKQVSSDSKNVKEKLEQVAIALQQYIPFDLLTMGFEKISKEALDGYSFLRIGFNEYQVLETDELARVARSTPEKLAELHATGPGIRSINTILYEEEMHRSAVATLLSKTFDIAAHLSLGLMLTGQKAFNINFYSRQQDKYTSEHADMLIRLQSELTEHIETIIYGNTPDDQHQAYDSAIKQDTRSFDGVIGNSYVMMNVFDKLSQVAPYDTSVLILGESGTGKERIADYIHRHSERKEKPFVKINCAALPPALIESELFGHEKGSFTGATDKRIGKFLLAHEGSIFLDEIGEMPIDMQVKLLRVLQEKEIEPVGGKSPVKVNVRIIAATNRNLEKEVAEGRFRLDLYYRLNVFPVQLPPLRERKEDIHSLVLHFISLCNRKANKKIEGVSDKVLTRMNAYTWPGNIRELENLVERSVLMARGTIIEDMDIPVAASPGESAHAQQDTQVKTIDENERDHILAVLAKTNGKIYGAGGAADLLRIPPTTLGSKIKKLGIKKGFKL
jgi:DNA-binding NtrC family response regulator